MNKYGGLFMKMKKVLLALAMVLGLTSCGINGTKPSQNPSDVGGSNTSECTDGVCGGNLELNLDVINQYIKDDPHWADLNAMGNKMALIPFTHINGPKAEWNLFAFVNFQYNARRYYKYQVTFLSCTCRSSEVNYWQTAYVELTTPQSGDINDVKLQMLSYSAPVVKGPVAIMVHSSLLTLVTSSQMQVMFSFSLTISVKIAENASLLTAKALPAGTLVLSATS